MTTSRSKCSLKTLLSQSKTLLAPGAYDGLSARLIEQAGFSAIYASGGAIARSAGFPDLGLLSIDEVAMRLAQMVEVTQIPIIADADTGFGNTLNVQRTVRLFERIGVSALHLEDQSFPKRCGHLDNKTLISKKEMVEKIHAAKTALLHDDVVLIARTDAIAVEGFEAAINRAKAYAEAGADMLFVEAPQTIEQIKKIAESIKLPKLINMFHGGKTPLVPLKQLEALGYAVVIVPSDLQRAAIFAMQNVLQVIQQSGDSSSIADQLTSFQEREAIIGTKHYLQNN